MYIAEHKHMKKISRVHDTSKLHMIQLCVSLKIYHISIVNMLKNTFKMIEKKRKKRSKKLGFT
jgi:hypothetical protein